MPEIHPRRLVCTLGVLLGLVAAVASQGNDPVRPTDGKPAVDRQRVTTRAAERRRLELPDRSVLFVNENTTVRILTDRLEVSSGEVFVELSPRSALQVVAGGRTLQATGARFDVRLSAKGARLTVAAGLVRVGEVVVYAGQTLAETAKVPSAAPCLEESLAWTRNLRPETDFLPRSENAGGTLKARGWDGDFTLPLRRYAVDVHIEDGFARTTIDWTFFNDTDSVLEGTFRFPLPRDASLSRLAMYVDGALMEGGMAERQHARTVYESIVSWRRDPALLEWMDGTTFRMRVFPIEPRQEKRLFLSYTQRLPSASGEWTYRFPAGNPEERVGAWSVAVRVHHGSDSAWRCESHSLTPRNDKGDLVLSATAKNAAFGQDLLVHVGDPGLQAGEQVRFSSAEHGGDKFLMLRYRPDLQGQTPPERRDWVILLETSADRDLVLMRAQADVVRSLLEFAGPTDTFQIVTAGRRARLLTPQPLPTSPTVVAQALKEARKSPLLGALDLGVALDFSRPLLEKGKSPHLVHVGSGMALLGENAPAQLAKKLPPGTRYVGVGVGKRWDEPTMRHLAEATRGYFTHVNPTDPLAWRGLQTALALNSPRLHDVTVECVDNKAVFLPVSRMLVQGEELVAVCRVKEGDLPTRVRVRGQVEGKEFSRDLEVKDVRARAEYVPRTWARLEINRLLLEGSRHVKQIVQLSRSLMVMTPFTSLLVLENDKMYEDWKIDRTGRDPWAWYAAPGKIAVRKEAPPAKQATAESVEESIAVWKAPTILHRPDQDNPGPAARMLWVHFDPAVRPTKVHGAGQEAAKENAVTPVQFGLPQAPPAQRGMALGGGLALGGVGLVGGVGGGGGFQVGGPPPLAVPAVFPVDDEGGIRTDQGLTPGRTPVDELTQTRRLPWGWWQEEPDDGTLLYVRPSYAHNEPDWWNVLGLAPGLNSTPTDIRAAIEAEAARPSNLRVGKVDEKARALITQARKERWRSLELPAVGKEPARQIFYDGTGRYTWTRTLKSGLREEVTCDGESLWHAYPEIGLAARRKVGRAHRLEFADVVPWSLPTVDDLALGADVKLLAADTVAVVPHSASEGEERATVMHLVFGKDGELVERRWVRELDDAVITRQTLAANGTIELFTRMEKPAERIVGKQRPARAPRLHVDTAKLVVVRLPFRVVPPGVEVNPDRGYSFNSPTDQPAWIELETPKGMKEKLGHWMLTMTLHGTEAELEHAKVESRSELYLRSILGTWRTKLEEVPEYKKLFQRWDARQSSPQDDLWDGLAIGRRLCAIWSDRAKPADAAFWRKELPLALNFAKHHKGSEPAWAVLGLVQDRLALRAGDQKAVWQQLADAYALFRHTPGLSANGRYEHARCLLHAGQSAEARRLFRTQSDDVFEAGQLLRIDADFRQALGSDWTAFVKQRGTDLVRREDWHGVILLGRQCWELGDVDLFEHLVGLAIQDIPVSGKKNRDACLTVIRWLQALHSAELADRLIRRVLTDPDHKHQAALWVVAARVAGLRDDPVRRLQCLERACETDTFAHGPEPGTTGWENVHNELLWEYEVQAEAMALLARPVPADFRRKVEEALYRALRKGALSDPSSWLDRTSVSPGIDLLRQLGETELARDYESSLLAIEPEDTNHWLALARRWEAFGERPAGDAVARRLLEREPLNGPVWVQRAQDLFWMQRHESVRQLCREILRRSWPDRTTADRASALLSQVR